MLVQRDCSNVMISCLQRTLLRSMLRHWFLLFVSLGEEVNMNRHSYLYGVLIACGDGRLWHCRSNFAAEVGEAVAVEMGVGVDDLILDLVTIPGPEGCCANPERASSAQLDVHAWDVGTLVKLHNAEFIVVCSHSNCGGHPVEDEQHHKDAVTLENRLLQMIDRPVGSFRAHASHVSDFDWPVKVVSARLQQAA
jgi:hypothetical protein